MNPARSIRAALVLNDQTSWWAYLAGPAVGGAIAAGIAYGLRGPGREPGRGTDRRGTLGARRIHMAGSVSPYPVASIQWLVAGGWWLVAGARRLRRAGPG